MDIVTETYQEADSVIEAVERRLERDTFMPATQAEVIGYMAGAIAGAVRDGNVSRLVLLLEAK